MTIEIERKQTPVLLLTGYLGSGKTTLVNRILSNADGIRFAVIVNDIGEVNIDADLIQKGGVVGMQDDSLVPLQNGCICCNLKMDLVSQLSEICQSGKFDYIVIEASGICEPEPIAQTICSMPNLVPPYAQNNLPKLDCIVTVVDALRMQSEFDCGEALKKEETGEDDIENLVIRQIEFCNTVLLNKVSEVSPREAGRVRSIIKALNPKAEVYECDRAAIDLQKILGTEAFDFEKAATSAAWIDAIEGGSDTGSGEPAGSAHEGPHEEHHGNHDDHDGHSHGREDEEHGSGHDAHHHGHHAEHHHHHHHGEGETEEYNISTYVYFRRPALDINRFDWTVAKKWPGNIIRAKGLCYFSDEKDRCCLFEQAGVQKSISDAGFWFAAMPQDQLEQMMLRDRNLRRDWDPVYGDRMIKIVFIGQNLDVEQIDSMMDSCLESPADEINP